jgi:DNA polymerase-3 subunit delta
LREGGECAPLVLLTGDSGFLIERGARAVADSVPEAERAWCLWRGSAAEADPDRLLDEASTLPMGGERRVLVIRDAEKLPVTEHAGWKRYLKNPSRRCVAVFVASPGADTKPLRILAEVCALWRLDAPGPGALPGWLAAEAKTLGCALERDAASWMIEVAGRDLALLYGWLERAALLRGGGRLGRAELEPLCGRQAPANLFALCDRVGEGNDGEALRLAQRALEDGEEPLPLLSRLANHLRRLSLVRHGIDRGEEAVAAARRAGVPGFLTGKMAAQARRRTAHSLGRALAACAGADRSLKSSRVSAARVFDRLILSAGAGEGRDRAGKP